MNILNYVLLGFSLCLTIPLDYLNIKLRNKRIIFYIIGFIFILFCSFRSFAYPDTIAYSDYFYQIKESIKINGFFHIDGKFEIGYEFLNKIVAVLGGNDRVLFFVVATISFILMERTFTSDKFVLIPLGAFIVFYGIYFNFVILRAGLAIMFFCYGAIKCKRKIVKIFLFLISVFFHQSILLAIILYFVAVIPFKKIKFKTLLIILGTLFIFYYFGLFGYVLKPIINFCMSLDIDIKLWARFMYYLKEYQFIFFEISIRYIVALVLFIYTNYLIIHNKKLQENKTLNVVQRLIFYALVISSLMGTGDMIILRFTDMLFIFNIINVTVCAAYMPNTILIKKNNLYDDSSMKNTQCIAPFLFICFYYILNLTFVFRLIGANIVIM